MAECKIIPIKKESIEIRLFDEERDIAQFLCFQYDLSYEQLFVKLIKEHAEHEFAQNENYKLTF